MQEESGNILDKIGLGNIAPMVKSGLDGLSNAEKDAVIGNIIDSLKDTNGNFFSTSDKIPPLGGFQDPSGAETLLSSKRMAELKSNLSNLFKELSSGESKPEISRFQKISILFNMIKGLFDNFSHFDNRASASNYSRLKL